MRASRMWRYAATAPHHYKIDFGDNGPTAYWTLATLCRHDHDLITNHGHLLAGGPGTWRWIAPARSAA